MYVRRQRAELYLVKSTGRIGISSPVAGARSCAKRCSIMSCRYWPYPECVHASRMDAPGGRTGRAGPARVAWNRTGRQSRRRQTSRACPARTARVPCGRNPGVLGKVQHAVLTTEPSGLTFVPAGGPRVRQSHGCPRPRRRAQHHLVLPLDFRASLRFRLDVHLLPGCSTL